MEQDGIAGQTERILAAAQAQVVGLVHTTLGAFGERPVLWTRGTVLDQIEDFLAVRDDPPALAEKLASWRAAAGLDAADLQLLAESTRLERAIEARGGYDAVRAALFLRRLQRAGAATKAADKLESMPRAEVRPALQPLSDEDLLNMGRV